MDTIQFLRNLPNQPYFVCVLAIATSACFYYLISEKKTPNKIIKGIFYFVFIIVSLRFAGGVIYRSYHPVTWDFACFYLYGKVAAGGYNFYSPEIFHHVFNSLNLQYLNIGGFSAEVLNVGFPYPPPTILYFAPLGFLTIKAALLVWTIFNLFFVAGCIYLIYQMFFKKYLMNGLILVCSLFFMLWPSLMTVSSSQTNFILLFLLLLMKKYSDKKSAGIFLALAIFTKPYMIIFGLYFLFRMKWKTIIYFIISALVLVGITIGIFGTAPFIDYLFENPIQRLPQYVFLEDAYQSLYAVLTRSNIITPENPLTYLYIMSTIILLTLSYLFYLAKKKMNEFILPTLLLIGLLIYPGMLYHYGVLLLFIIYQFFDRDNPLALNRYINICIVGIFYFLSTFSLFSSILFLLILIIYKSLTPIKKAIVMPVNEQSFLVT